MSCQLNNVPAFIPKCEDIEKYTGLVSKSIAPFHYIEGEKCVYCSYEKKIEKLQEQNKTMREALEFYATEEDWYFYCSCCADGSTKLEKDHGKLAREALAKVKE